jgi:hypothetical protein
MAGRQTARGSGGWAGGHGGGRFGSGGWAGGRPRACFDSRGIGRRSWWRQVRILGDRPEVMVEAGPNLGGLAGGHLPPSPLPRDCARPGSFSIPDSRRTATRCRATSRRSHKNGREALTSLMPTPEEWPRGAGQPHADNRRMAERRWPAFRARADWRIENDPGPEAPRRTAPPPVPGQPSPAPPGVAAWSYQFAELPCWKPPAAGLS